jgi:hypothetical protein
MKQVHVAEFYTAYLEGSLPPAVQVNVEAHLRECSQCAQELTELSRLIEALHTLPPVEAPVDLVAQVRSRLPSAPPRAWWRWQPAMAYGIVVASLAIAFWLGQALAPGSREGTGSRMAAHPSPPPPLPSALPTAPSVETGAHQTPVQPLRETISGEAPHTVRARQPISSSSRSTTGFESPPTIAPERNMHLDASPSPLDPPASNAPTLSLSSPVTESVDQPAAGITIMPATANGEGKEDLASPASRAKHNPTEAAKPTIAEQVAPTVIAATPRARAFSSDTEMAAVDATTPTPAMPNRAAGNSNAHPGVTDGMVSTLKVRANAGVHLAAPWGTVEIQAVRLPGAGAPGRLQIIGAGLSLHIEGGVAKGEGSEILVPTQAGGSLQIVTVRSGGGKATFYLAAPSPEGIRARTDLNLGVRPLSSALALLATEAGTYIICPIALAGRNCPAQLTALPPREILRALVESLGARVVEGDQLLGVVPER